MPSWRLDGRDPGDNEEEEPGWLGRARDDFEESYEGLFQGERERDPHWAAGHEIKKHNPNTRVNEGFIGGGGGCLLPVVLLAKLLHMPRDGWNEDELRRLGGRDQTPETPEDVTREHEEAMRKLREEHASRVRRILVSGCLLSLLTFPLSLLWRRS